MFDLLLGVLDSMRQRMSTVVLPASWLVGWFQKHVMCLLTWDDDTCFTWVEITRVFFPESIAKGSSGKSFEH